MPRASGIFSVERTRRNAPAPDSAPHREYLSAERLDRGNTSNRSDLEQSIESRGGSPYVVDESVDHAARPGRTMSRAPNGSAPRDYRLTVTNRATVRAAAERILARPTQRIVLAHGIKLSDGAQAFLSRALAWLERH